MSSSNPAIKARIAHIRAQTQPTLVTIDALSQIREICGDAADRITKVVESQPKFDVGRLIAALDCIQQAKDVAAASMFLPLSQ